MGQVADILSLLGRMEDTEAAIRKAHEQEQRPRILSIYRARIETLCRQSPFKPYEIR